MRKTAIYGKGGIGKSTIPQNTMATSPESIMQPRVAPAETGFTEVARATKETL
ncbi:MAG TPA: hypothetical protein PKZ42_08395 [Syntrophales bacterium]|mgnify:CR=1 FL=1|nr:hypothetical protein [Syntrophales bacterium]